MGTKSNERDRQGAGEIQDRHARYVCVSSVLVVIKNFEHSLVGTTKGSFSAGTRDHSVTQAPIPILGEKVSKIVLQSSWPLTNQQALESG